MHKLSFLAGIGLVATLGSCMKPPSPTAIDAETRGVSEACKEVFKSALLEGATIDRKTFKKACDPPISPEETRTIYLEIAEELNRESNPTGAANVLRAGGYEEEAKRVLIEAARRWESSKYYSLASAYYEEAGDINNAVRVLLGEAQEFEKKADWDWAAVTYERISAVYLNAGMPQEAKEMLAQSKEMWLNQVKEYEQWQRPFWKTRIAWIYFDEKKLNDREKARTQFLEAAHEFEEFPNGEAWRGYPLESDYHPGENSWSGRAAQNYGMASQLFQEAGMPKEAKETLDKAKEMWLQFAEILKGNQNYIRAAQVFSHAGDEINAEEMRKKGLALCQEAYPESGISQNEAGSGSTDAQAYQEADERPQEVSLISNVRRTRTAEEETLELAHDLDIEDNYTLAAIAFSNAGDEINAEKMRKKGLALCQETYPEKSFTK